MFDTDFFLLAWTFAVVIGLFSGLVAAVVYQAWAPSLSIGLIGLFMGWAIFVRGKY